MHSLFPLYTFTPFHGNKFNTVVLNGVKLIFHPTINGEVVGTTLDLYFQAEDYSAKTVKYILFDIFYET